MHPRKLSICALIVTLTLAVLTLPATAETGTDARLRDTAQETQVQQIQDEIQTESMQFDVPEFETGNRTFIGGGGPIAWGALFDLDRLEAALDGVAQFGGDLQFGDRSAYLLMGGGGFGGRQFRTGGAGGGGSWTSPTSAASAFDQVTLDVSMGGFQIESLVAEHDGFGLSLGALLGRGGWTLTLTRNVSGAFSEIADEPAMLEMDRSFWFAMPFASVEYKFIPFMGLRLGGGMGATLSFGDWHVSSGPVAPNGPLKNTLFPVIQVMVVFGS